MNAVDLDFVPVSRWRLLAFPCALLGASVLWMTMCFAHWLTLKDDLTRFYVEREASNTSVMKEIERRRAQGKTSDLSISVTTTLAPLTHPWNQLLSELEVGNGEKMNITRLEHKYDESTLHLTVNAASFSDVQALVSRLNETSIAGEWRTRSVSRTPGGLRASLDRRVRSRSAF